MTQLVASLIRRLAEAEATIQSLLSGQVDAVVDAASSSTILLSEAQSALRDSEEQYRQIVEFTTDGIVKVDIDSVIVFSNLRFAEMLGYQLQGLLGISLFSFMTDDARSIAGEALKRRKKGLKDTIEITLRRRDGSEIAVSMAGAPILDEAGVFLGSLALVRDVTEQKRMLAQMAISDRMASVGTLAAGVAHEINNPLTVVMANLDYVAGRLKPKGKSDAATTIELQVINDIEEPLRDAREAAERMRIIVRDLKIFTRSKEAETSDEVNVQSTIESALRMAMNEIRHRAHLVKDYGQVSLVQANEVRLGQVFLNLIVNAAQAMPEGRIKENEIRIATRQEGEWVIIEVSDTGVGIPPEVVGRIYDAFFTTKPMGYGTGLGLAISHRIVTGMGGNIRVYSVVGKGTTFKVSLPAARGGPKNPPAPAPLTVTMPASRRGRILIVDDEELILRTVQRILSKEHDTVTATSGKEALALCLAGEQFDIILCDLMMPEMTGMELHHELMQFAPELAARMAFVTGGAFTPSAQEFLAHSDRVHIYKPFDPGKLLATVQRLMRASSLS